MSTKYSDDLNDLASKPFDDFEYVQYDDEESTYAEDDINAILEPTTPCLADSTSDLAKIKNVALWGFKCF